VLAIGRRLFDDGGIEALEAVIDTVFSRVGREAVAELVKVWTAVVEGEDLAA
jgi:hypothetical protein